jgi:hypothetical protein
VVDDATGLSNKNPTREEIKTADYLYGTNLQFVKSDQSFAGSGFRVWISNTSTLPSSIDMLTN